MVDALCGILMCCMVIGATAGFDTSFPGETLHSLSESDEGIFYDDCIGSCELVQGFSNRSYGMKGSSSATTNSHIRCGGVGERPCNYT